MKLLEENQHLYDFEIIENSIQICSPFISNNPLLDYILDNKIKLKLIIRLCEQTDSSLMRKLIDIYPNNIRYFLDSDKFHSKLFLFDKGAVFGSSNFTYDGLCNNKELNTLVNNTNPIYDQLSERFFDYWSNAHILTSEILDIFENQKNSTNHSKNDFEKELANQISKLSDETNRWAKLAKINQEVQSQAVVCLNTGKKYRSMKEAAMEAYGSKRGDYISQVCRGERECYKGHVWVYDFKYNEMTIEEKQKMIDSVKNFYSKRITMFMVDGITFRSDVKVIKYLGEKYNYQDSKQAFSEKKRKAEVRDIPCFCIDADENKIIVFYTEYEQLYDGKMLQTEYPKNSEREIKVIESKYKRLAKYDYGGCSLYDILFNDKKLYTIDGKIYSTKSIKNYYDEEIKRESVEYYVFDNGYSLANNLNIELIRTSKQKKYYIKNKCIYKNKNDYLNENIKCISRNTIIENILDEQF